MKYFVFSITEKCESDDTIDDRKIRNLDKIIDSILGQSGNGLPGEIQHFKIPNSNQVNKVSIFRNDYLGAQRGEAEFGLFITGFAHDLLSAELIKEKDGTQRRNKLITPGILIIKHEVNKLTLLKLEEKSSVDKSSYEFKDTLMTDRRYYKGAIITSDIINVIDKNRRVANYWAHDFLQLERERNDKDNTTYLISKMKTDSLVAKEINDKTLRKTITSLIKERIFSENRFEPDEWLEEVNNSIKDSGIAYKNIEELFSKEALEFLDETFEIDKKLVRQEFKTVIEVGAGIKIEALNIDTAIKAQIISFDDGYIHIQVPKENIEKIDHIFN